MRAISSNLASRSLRISQRILRFKSSRPKKTLEPVSELPPSVNGTDISNENSLYSPEMSQKGLIHEINVSQMDNATKIVPWFMSNMPQSYFRQTPEDLMKQHVTVISSLHNLSQNNLTVKIDNYHPEKKRHDYSYLSFDPINKGAPIGKLYSQVNEIVEPEGALLNRVNIYTSNDGTIDLNVFTFGEKTKMKEKTGKDMIQDSNEICTFIKELKSGKYKNDSNVPEYNPTLHSDEAMKEYYGLCDGNYVRNSSPRRFLIQREMFEKVKGTDTTEIHMEKSKLVDSAGDGEGMWLSMASANILPSRLLRLSSRILALQGLSILRAHLDTVEDPKGFEDSYGTVTMLRLFIEGDENGRNHLNDDKLEEFQYLMKRAKWLDDEVVQFGLEKHPELGIKKAEIIHAMASMLHGDLAKIAPHSFASVKSITSLLSSSQHFVSTSDAIAQLFLERFRPDHLGGAIDDATFNERSEIIRNTINELHFESAKTLLNRLLDVCHCTLKTNFYHEDRYALAFRLDPTLLVSPEGDDPMPHGYMFACGRNFQFFHNRFRDIARGGLRVVTPPNSDQHATESSRIFSECYGLSWAQQLKNKDIPEGGSKAVCLVNTPSIPEKSRFLETRRCVRACVDAILDLTVKESTDKMVDYYGKDELIYLGPDEQVVPSDCDWICMRAGERGYSVPMAFMSSKPGAGINHKEYGVTSEGVVVYLDTALKRVLNIDPKKDNFSIKITGGPDGDVGGNLLKILYREYPDTCKVLGIADGSGVAEDPQGLNLKELVNLFNQVKPIADYDKSKLSKDGICLSAGDPDGLSRRNSMAFRIKADAFIPAGGRPNTINGKNWKNFLLEDGKTPTSPLIVEGANLFLTPEARLNLFDTAGVSIVKDSSANKCGVITSSCEVSASMLLTSEEFLEHKDDVVDDVIRRLHEVAKDEAELLFREYKNFPGALPHFSERISNAINFVTDQVVEHLTNMNEDEEHMLNELRPLLKTHLPKKLVELKWDVVPEKLPTSYQRHAIAAILASHLVYKEGVHVVESQPADRIAQRAITYYKASVENDSMLKQLQSKPDLSTEDRNHLMKLLEKGGARTSCDFF
jgi:glutamate dehydrogenase